MLKFFASRILTRNIDFLFQSSLKNQLNSGSQGNMKTSIFLLCTLLNASLGGKHYLIETETYDDKDGPSDYGKTLICLLLANQLFISCK